MLITRNETRAIFLRESDGKAWNHVAAAWVTPTATGAWNANLLHAPSERTDLRCWLYDVPPEVLATPSVALVYEWTGEVPEVEWGAQWVIPVEGFAPTLAAVASEGFLKAPAVATQIETYGYITAAEVDAAADSAGYLKLPGVVTIDAN